MPYRTPRTTYRVPTWLLLLIVALGIGLMVAQGGDRSVEFDDARGETAAGAHTTEHVEA